MDDKGSDFAKNAAELRKMGKARLSLQERKRRRRALDALGVPDFTQFLAQQSVATPLRKEAVTMLQLNVGLLCNQACTHCHVESSPRRTEAMDEALVQHILRVLAASPEVKTVDITGGAPEMTPAFWPLVRGAQYEITSALSTSPRNWQCRVRVDGRSYLWRLSRQEEQLLDVGTVVQHATAGYMGVVVGYDDVCRRTDEWCLLRPSNPSPNPSKP